MKKYKGRFFAFMSVAVICDVTGRLLSVKIQSVVFRIGAAFGIVSIAALVGFLCIVLRLFGYIRSAL